MSTPRKKFFANRNPASSLRLPPAATLQFSNRNIPLLESHLSHSKQTIAIHSNRNILGVSVFLTKTRPVL
jgi:hypothetical protein